MQLRQYHQLNNLLCTYSTHMYKYLLYLQNPFVLGLIGGIIMVIVQYWDDSRNNYEIIYTDYLKIFVEMFIITTVLIYFSKFSINGVLSMFGGGSGSSSMGISAPTRIDTGASVRMDDMYTGMSDF